MTIIYALLMLLLIVFGGVQYNDPDGLVWLAIYLVPAIALGFAAFAPRVFNTIIGKILLTILIVAMAVGVFVFWPTQFSSVDGAAWWENEELKEGFGISIAYLFSCCIIPLAFRRSKRGFRKSTAS